MESNYAFKYYVLPDVAFNASNASFSIIVIVSVAGYCGIAS
jgi:hypothetical protein